jgi:hypothetical protein
MKRVWTTIAFDRLSQLLQRRAKGRIFLYVLKDTETAGGVSPVLAMLPANISIAAWVNSRWPNCSTERQGMRSSERLMGTFGGEALRQMQVGSRQDNRMVIWA